MIIEFITFVIIVFIIMLLFMFFKKIIYLIINSIIGLLALLGFNAVFNADVIINVWSLLITAIGGTIGFVIVILLHYFQVAF